MRAVNLQDDLKMGMRLGRVDKERQLEGAFCEYTWYLINLKIYTNTYCNKRNQVT